MSSPASPKSMLAEEAKPWHDTQSPSYLGERARKDLGLELKPVYKEIKAVYLNWDDEAQYSQRDLEANGVFVMDGITKGEEITKKDIADQMRAAEQALYNSYFPRRVVWTLARQVSQFMGLNICNILVLVLLTILSIMIYRNNNDDCPNFAKTNLFYAIIAIAWVLISLYGMHGAQKRAERPLKHYIGGFVLVMILAIIATGYGIVAKDDYDGCNSDSSQFVILIGTAVFTILDVVFFALIAKKLRTSILLQTTRQRRRNNNNSSANNRGNGLSGEAASAQNRPNREERPREERNQRSNRQQERGDRSAPRGDRYRADAMMRV